MSHLLRLSNPYKHIICTVVTPKSHYFNELSDCYLCGDLRVVQPIQGWYVRQQRHLASSPRDTDVTYTGSQKSRWGARRKLLEYAKTRQLRDLIFNIEQFHNKIAATVPTKYHEEQDSRIRDVSPDKWRDNVQNFNAQMEKEAAYGSSYKSNRNVSSEKKQTRKSKISLLNASNKSRTEKSAVDQLTHKHDANIHSEESDKSLLNSEPCVQFSSGHLSKKSVESAKHLKEKASKKKRKSSADKQEAFSKTSQMQNSEKTVDKTDKFGEFFINESEVSKIDPGAVHGKGKAKNVKKSVKKRQKNGTKEHLDKSSSDVVTSFDPPTALPRRHSSNEAKLTAKKRLTSYVAPSLSASQRHQTPAPRSLSAMLHVEHMQEVALPGVGSLRPEFLDEELRAVLNEQLMGSAMRHSVRDYLWRRRAGGAAVFAEHSARLWGQSIAQLGVGILADNCAGEAAASIAMDRAAQEAFNCEVAAYVDVCMHAGMLKKAHSLLIASFINRHGGRYAPRQKTMVVTDVNIYNVLMRAWAKQANVEAIRRLISQMDEHGIHPNLQSYAACLEALGRQAVFSSDVAAKLLSDIREAGFQLEDICNVCHFHRDEWVHVEKAIAMILPSFQANAPLQRDRYECPLLDDLNTTADAPRANPWHNLISTQELKDRMEQQLAVEMNEKVKVTSIEPAIPLSPSVIKARETLSGVKEGWSEVLTDSLKRNVQILEMKAKGKPLTNLLPYLKILDTESYVDLMMQEIEMLGMEMIWFSPTLSMLQANLGRRVRKRFTTAYKVQHEYTDKLRRTYRGYIEACSAEILYSNHREMWQNLLRRDNDGISLEENCAPWPYHVCKAVGKFLYGIILADVKVDVNCLVSAEHRQELPAFYTVYRPRMQQLHEEIKPHPVLVKLYKEAGTRELTFDPDHMPSVAPPLPWTSVISGGSLLANTDLLKHSHNSPQQMALLKSLRSSQLYAVFDALNAVSMCPWKINKPILDTIINIFNSGGDTHLDVPPPMSSCPEPPTIRRDMSSEQRMELMNERAKLLQRRKEMFSLWCTELYRLSIANKYRDEIFWFPHNMDFRGRLYACPPHFNHLGSDLARSLLIFAQGRPLGSRGLDWLKIHLVNLTGQKKRSSNDDRLAYANEKMDDILDSADHPLTGRKWWQTSDEPWQTLACCQEIAMAIRSPDPAAYVSHLPVHQDGSCNGLQHYAALARDQAGAESVNLAPFHVPKDVYSDVVEKVEADRKEKAANGMQIANILDGFVKRKVIKQTIMTTVYGVTRYGARQQIRRQLEDLDQFPQKYTWEASFYLTDMTFKGLQEMFSSTKEIQDWLVLSAKLISKVCLAPVEWLTPIGWPVIQPYVRQNHVHSKAASKKGPRRHLIIEKPNAMKQKNAFPPNFIHSLDSTHMMLTAIFCLRAGISFVSVHDCFWTHACDVETMNKICREQFVALHNEPILEQLSAFMLDKYGYKESDYDINDISKVETMALVNHVLGRVPNRGSFKLDNVLDSTYFFS